MKDKNPLQIKRIVNTSSLLRMATDYCINGQAAIIAEHNDSAELLERKAKANSLHDELFEYLKKASDINEQLKQLYFEIESTLKR